MFKRAFNKFLKKNPSNPDLYPYLYSIGFRELMEPKKEMNTTPIQCKQCQAVLIDVNIIQEDPKTGSYYICEFCGEMNHVDKDKIPKEISNDVEFILEAFIPKIPEKEGIPAQVRASEGELYISVIDISGSMSGAKIEAVKKSLVETLKDFKMNAPTTKYLLIAFESSVYYYVRHDSKPIVFGEDNLFALEGIRDQFEKSINKKHVLGSIGEFADGWIRKIRELRSMDMTALGPALFLSIISFEKFGFPSGRITLLTDGMANRGIGNLSGTSIGAERFYERMGDICNKNTIVIDVVGVSNLSDSSELGLQTLGKLTDKTGGKMFLISDREMSEAFAELQHRKYIGREVNVKVITPNNIIIKNITGAAFSPDLKKPEVNLGAITEDRELYVELDASKGFESEKEIPVQLQVAYRDKLGNKRLRVINDKVQITSNENDFKRDYDQKLNAMYHIQTAGISQYAGNDKEPKKRLKTLHADLQKEMMALKRSKGIQFIAEEDFTEGLNIIQDELEEIDKEEEMSMGGPQVSHLASFGQERYRQAYYKVKERMEEKEKKKKK